MPPGTYVGAGSHPGPGLITPPWGIHAGSMGGVPGGFTDIGPSQPSPAKSPQYAGGSGIQVPGGRCWSLPPGAPLQCQ